MSVALILILSGVLVQASLGYYVKLDDGRWNHATFHANLKHLFHESSAASTENICCANGQWEANAYVNAVTKLTIENVTMIVYYNGTGKIAFDEVDKKSYISFNVTESAPGTPKQYHKKSTAIKDYATGITYEIDDGDCFQQANSEGMQIVCVPENAKQISKGSFGSTDVTTFQFSTSQPPLEIVTTPTVRQNGTYCDTIMFSYALFSDDGVQEFVYDIEVIDITRGIQDPSIFVPPKSCG
ncbi:uncharacterized protein LOC123564140 isoform X2 [Mercenaria mercenaria]|uniref:uncharacterized protein LOC123564140 isoform X2 n=1 Tax=Mercenaria mercenaria TaxID=6596 RepID=UPI00234EDACC|nr:uncharacterized protein LOC123564140 isoform X2 [Mercenaria mercenaria]